MSDKSSWDVESQLITEETGSQNMARGGWGIKGLKTKVARGGWKISSRKKGLHMLATFVVKSSMSPMHTAAKRKNPLFSVILPSKQ